jgi:hypothetical protein
LVNTVLTSTAECETVLPTPTGERRCPVTVFAFTLTVEGADLLRGDAVDALFVVGCDDATFGISNDVQTADFDREAPDFAEAVASAIRAVEGAVPGARVVEVRRDRVSRPQLAEATDSFKNTLIRGLNGPCGTSS